MQTRSACTALIRKTQNICVKTIQRHKLWYNFPVVTQSYSGEQAVSFEKVSLPELLHKEMWTTAYEDEPDVKQNHHYLTTHTFITSSHFI